jgi:hypothetical protein
VSAFKEGRFERRADEYRCRVHAAARKGRRFLSVLDERLPYATALDQSAAVGKRHTDIKG